VKKFPLSIFVTGTLALALVCALTRPLAARQGSDSHQATGKPIYEKTCSRCHGLNGDDGKAPTLVPFRWTFNQALDIVRHGGPCGMPAFKESEVSDEELKQIVDYLKED